MGHTTNLDLGAYEVIPGTSGPAIPLTPGCEHKDFDHDGDTDQSDFAIVLWDTFVAILDE